MDWRKLPRPYRKNGKYIKCAHCGREIYMNLKRLNIRKYCCNKCYYSSKRGKKLSKEWVDKIRKSNLGKVMSKEAREKIRIGLMGNKNGKGHINSKKVIDGVIKYRFVKGHIPWCKGMKRPDISGPKHPNWRGGTSYGKYSSEWTKTLKEYIRNRDNYKCQMCGKEQRKPKLNVHHIDYNKHNCKQDNLITLCSSCHMKTNSNHEKWLTYFKNKSLNRYLDHA